MSRVSSRLAYLLLIALSTTCLTLTGSKSLADNSGKASVTPKQALGIFNPLIGGWRGVGQPKRSSRVGAWQETAEWVWDFTGKNAAIRYDVKDGKLVVSAKLSYSPESGEYRLTTTLPDKSTRTHIGKQSGNKTVLESKPDGNDYIHRVTITQLNEKRTIVLFERRKQTQSFYFRVASVGYTRAGTSLAVEGANDLECIVSGGKGTIKVSHKGKVYWVCCTGCKQAFDDDPEGVIADYKKLLEEREAEKKAKAKSKS